MLLLVNNAVQKMRTRVTNMYICLLSICLKGMKFKKIFLVCEKLKTSVKQINNKRTLVNLYKDIVLVTRLHIFCTVLFTNYNIKVVIQIDAFLANQRNSMLILTRNTPNISFIFNILIL